MKTVKYIGLGISKISQYHENAEHFQDTENPFGFSSALV